MGRCIGLALLGKSLPRLNPPYVGAMVVSPDGNVLGEGYRSFLSGTRMLCHAERMALDAAGERARGGTLITTLEPCVKPASKRTILRPCTEFIVEHGIKEVVVGLQDSSATVRNGAGIIYLQQQGIDVQIYEGMADTIRRTLVIR